MLASPARAYGSDDGVAKATAILARGSVIKDVGGSVEAAAAVGRKCSAVMMLEGRKVDGAAFAAGLTRVATGIVGESHPMLSPRDVSRW